MVRLIDTSRCHPDYLKRKRYEVLEVLEEVIIEEREMLLEEGKELQALQLLKELSSVKWSKIEIEDDIEPYIT